MSDKLLGGIKAGSTDVSLPVELRSSADSTEATGKAHGDVTLSYWRQGGTRTAISAASLAAVDSAHSDGGWKEVDATNMPGLYRLDVPDAAFATGADWVAISVKCAGCFTQHFMYSLTTEVIQSGDAYARLGAPSGASIAADLATVDGVADGIKAKTDNLPASPAATGDIPSAAAVAGQVRTELGTELGRIDATVSSRLASASYSAPPSAAAVASQVRTELTTELDEIGEILLDTGTSLPAAIPSASTVAAAVEAAILNEGDATALLAAIAAKVEEFLNNDGDAEATLTAIATAVRAELATELGRIDATVSSRLAAASYSAAPSAATVASQVRTELGTELGRIDAAVSSRLASGSYSAPPSAATVASQVRTELTTELGRIDAAVTTRLASASYSAPPSAGSIADAVWDEALSGHSTAGTAGAALSAAGSGGSAPTAAAIADAVWDEALAGHTGVGSAGAALSAAGSSGDPWTATPDGYDEGTMGALFSKLDVGEPEETVIVLPSAPVDASLCRVYGYFETVDNLPAVGVEIVFELVAADASKSNKILVNRRRVCTTDAQGRLSDGTNAYVDLQRTDNITPAGALWRVIAPRTVKWTGGDTFALEATTFDLASLIS